MRELLERGDITATLEASYFELYMSSSRALCPMCHRSMPVTRAGQMRVHGPLSNRCGGSGMSPSSTAPANRESSSVVQDGPPSQTPTSPDLHLRPSSVRIVKRIPRASRHLAATKLAGILGEVTDKNDISSWTRLSTFSSRCLALPKRGGQRRSLATAVNAQLRDESELPTQPPHQSSEPRVTRDPLSNLAKRVSSKLEEGDFKGAVRITCSEDMMADLNEETLSALHAKHPPLHPDSSFPAPLEIPPSLFPLSEKEVVTAIRSFPCGSAGGPDGLRPQHLKDLTSESAERGGRELIRALSSFIFHILEGNTPVAVQPFFFGATLIALRKKGGGIRPIAVGQTLRRLAAKCAGFRMVESMGASLAPQQLGYGVPLGGEAAAHAARRFLDSMSPGQLLLKLDFRNAFNSLRRDKMLTVVKDVAPDLFRFVSSAYERPSSLFYGDHIIQSAEGVQQGDPLGPLLFCLTIHPLVSRLKSSFAVFYLDDGTLGGPLQEVLSDLRLVEEEAAKLGLHLNHSKSELICDDAPTREAMLFEVPGLHNVSCSQATLLGSPIGKVECISDTIKEKTKLLKLMGGRLSHLQSHDALLLLRHSFAIPKVLYTLRTAPCFLSPDLETFDETLRTILTSIVNVRLDDVSAWLQASLPVRAGGIGIRRTVQLAPSAYLASATGCSELVHQILPPHLLDNPDPHFEAALDLWREGHPHPPPIHPASCAQRKWDAPRIEATFNSLLESANQLSQARKRICWALRS